MFKVLTDEALEIDIQKDYTDFRLKDETGYSQDILIWTREAQLKQTMEDFIKWGDEKCPHYSHLFIKKYCDECWQELKEAG